MCIKYVMFNTFIFNKLNWLIIDEISLPVHILSHHFSRNLSMLTLVSYYVSKRDLFYFNVLDYDIHFDLHVNFGYIFIFLIIKDDLKARSWNIELILFFNKEIHTRTSSVGFAWHLYFVIYILLSLLSFLISVTFHAPSCNIFPCDIILLILIYTYVIL